MLGAHECETAEPPLSAMTGSGIPHSAPTAGSLGMTRMERGRQVEPGHSLLSVLWYLMSGLYLLITEVAISMVHCVERGVHNSGAPRTVLAAAPSVACYSAEHVPGLVLAWVALALVTVGVPVAAAAGFARSPSCGAREAGSRLSRCCTSSALRRCTTLTLVVVVSSALEDHGHAAARVVRMAVCCAALLADGATAWWLSHHCSRGAAGPGSAPAALHLGCSLAACGVAIGSSQPLGLPSPSVVVWASVAAALVLLLVCLWVHVGRAGHVVAGVHRPGPSTDPCIPVLRHDSSQHDLNFGTPLRQRSSLPLSTASVDEQGVVLTTPTAGVGSTRWSMRGGAREASTAHLLSEEHRLGPGATAPPADSKGQGSALGHPWTGASPRPTSTTDALVASLQTYRGHLVASPGSKGAEHGGSSATADGGGGSDRQAVGSPVSTRSRSRRLPSALTPVSTTDQEADAVDSSHGQLARRLFPPSPSTSPTRSPSSSASRTGALVHGGTRSGGGGGVGGSVRNPLTPTSVASTGLRYRRVLLRPTFAVREGDSASRHGAHREAEYQPHISPMQRAGVCQPLAPDLGASPAVVVHEVVMSRH